MSLSPADIGHRVVIRRLLTTDSAERPRFSDLLGVLVRLDAEDRRVVVQTAAGVEVSVPVGEIAAAKRIPPKRERSAPADREVPEDREVPDLELERIAALGWQGLEIERLGGWLLRAAGGWTGRANSVLPLGDPGLPLDAALDHVSAWYSARHLPPTMQLPLPAREDLRAALAERGWTDRWGALVLTAGVAALRAKGLAVPGLPPVTVVTEPGPAWLAAYHYRGGALPPVAPAVLRAAAAPAFAAVEEAGKPITICRLSVDEGWVGITAVEVSPGHRRCGLATHLLAGALDWAFENGVRSAYLQVDSDNTAALALYEKAGFRVHHAYRYYRPTDF
jgi:GNAT superfamily N-acetyltransferase